MIYSKYKKFFSINEIEESAPLQLCMLCIALCLFHYFYKWMPLHTITKSNAAKGAHLCWPYFTSCGDWYFFDQLPLSYSPEHVLHAFIYNYVGSCS